MIIEMLGAIAVGLVVGRLLVWLRVPKPLAAVLAGTLGLVALVLMVTC